METLKGHMMGKKLLQMQHFLGECKIIFSSPLIFFYLPLGSPYWCNIQPLYIYKSNANNYENWLIDFTCFKLFWWTFPLIGPPLQPSRGPWSQLKNPCHSATAVEHHTAYWCSSMDFSSKKKKNTIRMYSIQITQT